MRAGRELCINVTWETSDRLAKLKSLFVESTNVATISNPGTLFDWWWNRTENLGTKNFTLDAALFQRILKMCDAYSKIALFLVTLVTSKVPNSCCCPPLVLSTFTMKCTLDIYLDLGILGSSVVQLKPKQKSQSEASVTISVSFTVAGEWSGVL